VLVAFVFWQVKYNIVQCVYPELQNLYHWLEVEFNPLKLAARVQTSLEFISKKEELVQYTAALQDITVMRIVKQVITAMLPCANLTLALLLFKRWKHQTASLPGRCIFVHEKSFKIMK
jgi:hypothetical protein